MHHEISRGRHSAATPSRRPNARSISRIVAPVVTTSSTAITIASIGTATRARIAPMRPTTRAAPALPDCEPAPTRRVSASTTHTRTPAGAADANPRATPRASGKATCRPPQAPTPRRGRWHDPHAHRTISRARPPRQGNRRPSGHPHPAHRLPQRRAQGGPGLVKESADIRASGVLGGEHNPAQRPGVVTENHAGDRDVPSLHRGKDGRGRGQRAAGRTQHLIPRQAPRALDGQQRAQQSLRQRSAARTCHRTHPA